MWKNLKEVWPKAFLTIAFLLIAYGFFCGVRMILKDEKKRRSDAANYITGQVINADGGMVM